MSAWRGDRHAAVLSPAPDRPTPSAIQVAAEMERLAAADIRRVLTGALHQNEVAPFLANGFVEHDHLHLLSRDLRDLPEARPGVRHRRARRRDQPRVLEIDAAAFDDFWALDRRGLHDAIRATPVSRYRVSTAGRTVTGYAVTGRAADRGYLQRLAVDPGRHRSGHGVTLVADALAWLRRTGARTVVVNTQERNRAAHALYLACGFVAEPSGLTVLVADLVPRAGNPPT